MSVEMTTCKTCGFEWDTLAFENCGHDSAIATGAARTSLRDGLADLADAIMLIGTALGFANKTKCINCGFDNPEGADESWGEFEAQAAAWAERMSLLYPELNTDEQFNAACARLERAVGK